MSEAAQPKDTIITRILGIGLGVILMFTFVQLASTMGWHPVVGGILTGLSGAIMGAMGTSFHGAYTTAVLGNAGATNFILGIALFLGLDKLIMPG